MQLLARVRKLRVRISMETDHSEWLPADNNECILQDKVGVPYAILSFRLSLVIALAISPAYLQPFGLSSENCSSQYLTTSLFISLLWDQACVLRYINKLPHGASSESSCHQSTNCPANEVRGSELLEENNFSCSPAFAAKTDSFFCVKSCRISFSRLLTGGIFKWQVMKESLSQVWDV